MMEIFTFDQGSDEWRAARCGIPTASEFHTVLAKGKTAGAESITRRKYLLQLAGEVLTGEPMEGYSNGNMERGQVMEAEARDLYAFIQDDPLARVGFIRNGPKGCSPDSLVGDKGMVEIKTAFPHILLDKLLRGDFPPEHKAQCQGALWVAERDWIDIAVYWPRLPLFTKRATRDDAYIANLASEVDRFNDELAETVERIRSYGTPRQPLREAFVQSIVSAG